VREGRTRDEEWVPRPGSYEESVLSWQEQIDAAFRRRAGNDNGSGPRMVNQPISTSVSFRGASGSELTHLADGH